MSLKNVSTDGFLGCCVNIPFPTTTNYLLRIYDIRGIFGFKNEHDDCETISLNKCGNHNNM